MNLNRIIIGFYRILKIYNNIFTLNKCNNFIVNNHEEYIWIGTGSIVSGITAKKIKSRI